MYAINHLGKDVENRTWPAPKWLIGQWFAIHGGAEPKGATLREARQDLESLQARGLAPASLTLAETITPGIVSVAKLDRCFEDSDDDPLSESPWFSGPFGWVWLELVGLPEPVPCRGALGLWDVPQDVLARVREQFRGARSSPFSETTRGGFDVSNR